MRQAHRQWSLGFRLAVVLLPFLLFTTASIGLTLWVSWQLDGGAAAVNEAGRLRMQVHRMARSMIAQDIGVLRRQVAEFDTGLELLRHGDTQRPLFVPWDATVRERFAAIDAQWAKLRPLWIHPDDGPVSVDIPTLDRDTGDFTAEIDSFVHAIEKHMSRWTAIMHLAQMALLGLAVLASAALIYSGYVFVLEPVGWLTQAIRRVQQGDLATRIEYVASDEFGTLAEGFNSMAEHLQSVHASLETRVQEKTAELAEKHERLEALYEVSGMVAAAASSAELAHGFVRRVLQVSHADAALLRGYDAERDHFVPLAWEGLSEALVAAESTLAAGQCAGGATVNTPSGQDPALRVVALDTLPPACMEHFRRAGFTVAVTVPVRGHQRTSGELDLFFRTPRTLSDAERSLLDALAAHLAAGLDNIRLVSFEKEAAVSEERGFIARELHDSIAQSLAFLKIQVQLMRDALAAGDTAQMSAVLTDIDAGVRESYSDVRELLVHFRTRADAGGIESALQATLGKFEHQSGLHAELSIHGHAMPLPPDVQIQVLHIVQEALSNIRKHACASRVRVDVWKQPVWRFEVCDDGRGFADGMVTMDTLPADITHVGLRIMHERAALIGAALSVESLRGQGTRVSITLPALPAAGNATVSGKLAVDAET